MPNRPCRFPTTGWCWNKARPASKTRRQISSPTRGSRNSFSAADSLSRSGCRDAAKGGQSMTKSPLTTRRSCAALGLLAALFFSTGPSAERAEAVTAIPGDPVATPNGKIAGKLLASGVRAYLGIPYAAAPVRELRWRAMQPLPPWVGVYNADRFAPECIQVLRRHDLNHYFGE